MFTTIYSRKENLACFLTLPCFLYLLILHFDIHGFALLPTNRRRSAVFTKVACVADIKLAFTD